VIPPEPLEALALVGKRPLAVGIAEDFAHDLVLPCFQRIGVGEQERDIGGPDLLEEATGGGGERLQRHPAVVAFDGKP
jgi:hypothetical protein